MITKSRLKPVPGGWVLVEEIIMLPIDKKVMIAQAVYGGIVAMLLTLHMLFGILSIWDPDLIQVALFIVFVVGGVVASVNAWHSFSKYVKEEERAIAFKNRNQ